MCIAAVLDPWTTAETNKENSSPSLHKLQQAEL